MNQFEEQIKYGREDLIYEFENSEEADLVSIEIIKNNLINGLLQISTKRINNHLSVIYDHQGYTSLSNLMQQEISLDLVLNCFETILVLSNELDDYMISKNSIVLDPNYIYIDARNVRTGLVLNFNKSHESVDLKQFFISLKDGFELDEDDLLTFSNLCMFLGKNYSDELFLRKVRDIKGTRQPIRSRNRTQSGSNDPIGSRIFNPNVTTGGSRSTELNINRDVNKPTGFKPSFITVFGSGGEDGQNTGGSVDRGSETIIDLGDDSTVIDDGESNTVVEIEISASLVNQKDHSDIPLINQFTRLGRESSNDVIIDKDKVSRKHAEIRRKNNSYFLIDVDSKNGTRLNGSRINSNQEYELHNGDVIIIADEKFMFDKKG